MTLTRILVRYLLAVILLSTLAQAQLDPADATRHRDPDAARLITRDIDNFWRAYDKAGPNDACDVFQDEYINKGSIGLRDFVQLRIDSACTLANWVARHPLYYASIRPSTLRIASFAPQIREAFHKLKELYPDAIFPDVYFVVGRMTSGGTTSYNGLLIGAEMFGRTPDMPTSELTDWHKQVLMTVDTIPGIVAHELIHFQQKPLKSPTLLARSLREGSADFVGGLISGRTINAAAQAYGDQHEQELWSEFKQVMNGYDTSGWLYNGGYANGRPADLGYYMGFKISQAYYDKAQDKKQAIRDILEVRDVDQFLKASGYGSNLRNATAAAN